MNSLLLQNDLSLPSVFTLIVLIHGVIGSFVVGFCCCFRFVVVLFVFNCLLVCVCVFFFFFFLGGGGGGVRGFCYTGAESVIIFIIYY